MTRQFLCGTLGLQSEDFSELAPMKYRILLPSETPSLLSRFEKKGLQERKYYCKIGKCLECFFITGCLSLKQKCMC